MYVESIGEKMSGPYIRASSDHYIVFDYIDFFVRGRRKDIDKDIETVAATKVDAADRGGVGAVDVDVEERRLAATERYVVDSHIFAGTVVYHKLMGS